MRVLCLTSRLPYPPNRGDRSRVFHFLQHLSREHELCLISFIAHDAERDHLAVLRAFCQDIHILEMSPLRSALSVVSNLYRREPLQALYYRLPAARRLIDQVIAAGDFQAAYVHLFRMAPYLVDHAELYRIVDLTDVISKEIRLSLPYRGALWRLIYQLEQPRIERFERWVAETFEETWLISQSDCLALQQQCPLANLQVVPIGIDRDRFYPIAASRDPNHLVFVGHMSVPHNIDAAVHLVHDVLPLVRQQIPDCTLEIVGAEPAPQVQRLADDPAVDVTGFVPDLNTHLNRAAAFVAPMRFAAGIQTKILEAMAAGRPVVTTSLANQGLVARPEREVLIADDARTTAHEIVKLLTNPPLAEQLGRAGRRFVEQRYSWSHVLKRMRHIEATLQQGNHSSNLE